jgi:uncharacterized delta-60 repeat protein
VRRPLSRAAAVLAAALLALGATPALARPGDLDHGFARGGAALEFGADSTEGDAIAVDQFGRTVVGGAEAAGRLLVMRLATNGRRDKRFGRDGLATVTLPGLAPTGVKGLDVFRDGRIVLAATLDSPDGSLPSRIVVARMLPDGDLDPGFGDDGIAVVGPAGAHASSLSLTRDGVILVGGALPVSGGDAPLVLRLAPDGTPDTAFDGDGVWSGETTTLRGWARDVLAYADGSVAFVVGAAPDALAPSVFVAARLTAAGALDPTFGGGDGIADVPLSASPARDGGAVGIVSGPGGRLVMAGTTAGPGGRAEGAVVRLLGGGALDPKFGRGGVARLTASRGLRLAALARGRDGRLVVGGRSASPNAAVLRLRANGVRDRTFGRRGSVVRAIGQLPIGRRTYSTVAAVTVQRGGGVLTAGTVADDNTLPGRRIGRRFLVVARLRG